MEVDLEGFVLGWLLYTGSFAAGSVWEILSPNRPMNLRSTVPQELKATGLVVLYDFILLFVFAMLMPMIFEGGLGDALTAMGVYDLPMWSRMVLTVVCFDITFYWAHRFMHSRKGWAIHRWHHASSDYFSLIAMRVTLPHMFLSRFTFSWYLVFDVSIEFLMVFAIYSTLHNFWQHLNVSKPWMRHLEWFLSTPRTHSIHHLKGVRFANKNFCALSTVWDRIFGTYMDPDTVENIEREPYGINDKTDPVRVALGV